MLLSQFKTGSAASSFRAGASSTRDGFVMCKARNLKKPQEVRAAKSEGWLESTTSPKLEKVGGSNVLEKSKLQDGGSATKIPPGSDLMEYKGTVMIMKKLLLLDLVDPFADFHDVFGEIFLGKHVTMQLVSTEIDPSTGKAFLSKATVIEKWVNTLSDLFAAGDLKFNVNFVVPKDFGVPGAIIVKNEHPNEFLLESFCLEIPDNPVAHYVTQSWVYNTAKTEGRIFFRNKAYLPGDTPASLKDLRAKELENLRGDGTGERKTRDRIYDYATYNDLGNPDKDPKFDRPTLGGNAKYPFPRRVRSGRASTKTNPECETRDAREFYIPRDECFDRAKNSDFLADAVRTVLQQKVTSLFTGKPEFDSVAKIMDLYVEKGKDTAGINHTLPDLPDVSEQKQFPLVFLQQLTRPDGKTYNPTDFPIPQVLQSDAKAWQNNDEFAREFLAGLNPVVIALVTEFPIKSKLKEFGYPVSAITAKHIEGKLEGLSVEEAVTKKKLYVADYHDSYLPFLEDINKQEHARSYATRALFFLSKEQTLKVLALELALPPKTPGGPLNSRVFSPPTDNSKLAHYKWETAKAHVSNNDITAHQVFSHFTRCHAVTEAVIIVSNRCLSKLHPIMQLMAPHLKSTLEINRQARLTLINAGGSIETHFTPRAFSLAMGAVNYRDTWTFESQALPNDLVARGMAVRDETSKHGVKLVVEDYPYAADGLELWSAIKAWNTEYVDIWYKDDSVVQNDVELQAWFKEMREEAHGDKKDAPGWPVLDSKKSLVEILTTIQWIASCQHAAVNFGQYDYAGYMPHHPTIVRRLIPEEGTKEWDAMKNNPEKFYLSVISSVDSTTTAMSVYEVLSAHSPEEEYIGRRRADWTDNEEALTAFKRFSDNIDKVDMLINERNADKTLKNRYGVVKMPYQLLRPKSRSGVTAMGVPNSITI